MESSYIIGSIIIATIATYLTRVIPFVFFAKKEPSALVRYIEWNMPLMIMVILIFYALKDVQWAQYPYGLAEILGITVAAFVHVRFGNALVSIISATAIYMLLIQKVFV